MREAGPIACGTQRPVSYSETKSRVLACQSPTRRTGSTQPGDNLTGTAARWRPGPSTGSTGGRRYCVAGGGAAPGMARAGPCPCGDCKQGRIPAELPLDGTGPLQEPPAWVAGLGNLRIAQGGQHRYPHGRSAPFRRRPGWSAGCAVLVGGPASPRRPGRVNRLRTRTRLQPRAGAGGINV